MWEIRTEHAGMESGEHSVPQKVMEQRHFLCVRINPPVPNAYQLALQYIKPCDVILFRCILPHLLHLQHWEFTFPRMPLDSLQRGEQECNCCTLLLCFTCTQVKGVSAVKRHLVSISEAVAALGISQLDLDFNWYTCCLTCHLFYIQTS